MEIAVGVHEISPNLNHRRTGENAEEEDTRGKHVVKAVNEDAEGELGEEARILNLNLTSINDICHWFDFNFNYLMF